MSQCRPLPRSGSNEQLRRCLSVEFETIQTLASMLTSGATFC